MPLSDPNQTSSLQRSLGLRDSLAVVIGSMIGTGIFLKTASMTQNVGSFVWVTLAWFVAGTLSVLGAMTYAELGAKFPHAGGGYIYVREAYGRLPAFLAGWISIWIIYPGSIAAYAVAAATFADGVFPVNDLGGPHAVSVGLILIFGSLNCLAISFGGALQSFLTGIKIFLMMGLILGIFFLSSQSTSLSTSLSLVETTTPSVGAFALATVAALWAFDGWEGISRVAGEIRDPQRTVLLALILGTIAVFGLYCLLNLAYFWALPVSEIVNANSTAFPSAPPVAAKAAAGFLGQSGLQVLSVVFLISTIGAMNGTIMTSARVPFAMAKDGLFFGFLSHLSHRTKVPVRSIWAQVAISIVLALSGTFDQLTNYVVFSAWIFYGMTGAAVFVFRNIRNKNGHEQKTYQVPGYPWVPAVFVFMAVALVIATLFESPKESLIGIAMIISGIPFYFLFFRTVEKRN